MDGEPSRICQRAAFTSSTAAIGAGGTVSLSDGTPAGRVPGSRRSATSCELRAVPRVTNHSSKPLLQRSELVPMYLPERKSVAQHHSRSSCAGHWESTPYTVEEAINAMLTPVNRGAWQ